jgi:hypothetical protein
LVVVPVSLLVPVAANGLASKSTAN